MTYCYQPYLWNAIPLERIGQAASFDSTNGSAEMAALEVDWMYMRDHKARHIPMVYNLNDYFVVDEVTILDAHATKLYYDKYKNNDDCAKMTQLELRIAEADNPFSNEIPTFFIDGIEVETIFGCSHCYLPWEREAKENSEHHTLKNEIIKRYQTIYPFLGDSETCYTFSRYGLCWADRRRTTISEVSILYPKTEKWIPIQMDFDIPMSSENPRSLTENDEGDSLNLEPFFSALEFRHPVTKMSHTIYATKADFFDLEESFQEAEESFRRETELIESERKLGGNSAIEYRLPRENPFQWWKETPFVGRFLYELIPSLPDGDRVDLFERDLLLNHKIFLFGDSVSGKRAPHGGKVETFISEPRKAPFAPFKAMLAGIYTKGNDEEKFCFRIPSV